MKNLLFALAFALICISIFSCDDKSVINPQNEEFKITTFSPISGFIASEVILFGENLTKDSIVSVTFGEQTAEILSRTDSLLIVKVPDITVDQYDITVKTKTQSYVYDKKYEVLQQEIILDFTQYKNYSISVKGLQVKYQKYHQWQESNPANHGSSIDTLIYTAFTRSHKNPFPITISEDGTNKYKCLELYRDPYTAYPSITVQFEIDKINSKFKTIFFKNCDYHGTTQDGNQVDLRDELKLDLSDVAYIVNADFSEINVKLNKEEILSKLSNFSFKHSNDYVHYNTYDKSTETFLEILGINDDATIEIKFTK